MQVILQQLPDKDQMQRLDGFRSQQRVALNLSKHFFKFLSFLNKHPAKVISCFVDKTFCQVEHRKVKCSVTGFRPFQTGSQGYL